MDSFRDNVKRAHASFQAFLEMYGKWVSRGTPGDCQRFFNDRTAWISYASYPNVPADLQNVHNQYRTAIDNAVNVVAPLLQVCSAGGGSIELATMQHMFDVVDASQNQLYQVRRQIEGIP